ncbi:MAG: low temperature requirement protein A [Aureibaculum sp.]|nr:low temperature requirement protein A [Aureibaculum sp.]
MKKILLRSKNLVSPSEQSADFVELFFDLVFVYAITRITSLTANHLDTEHVLQSLLIFWLIWWAWTQFTWALNAANTKIAEVRVIVLIATGVAFVMASSTDFAFTEEVMWFAIPYVIIRIIGLALYIRVTTNLNGHRSAVIGFALLSITGLIAVLAGAMVDPSLRIIFWLGAILLDMLAGFIGGRAEGWSLQSKHFGERHSLIIIIALGESLIVAATAVGGQERSQDLMLAGGLAVIVTCLLWWSYFSWISDYLEEKFSEKSGSDQAMTGRDTYSFMHFLIICGIVGIAVGFEKILHHPHDLLKVPVAFALGIGYMLFIGFSITAVWRTSKMVLLPRLLILLISLLGIVLSIGHSPLIALGIISIGLTIINFIEWKRCRKN